jgi:hypothetical protein
MSGANNAVTAAVCACSATAAGMIGTTGGAASLASAATATGTILLQAGGVVLSGPALPVVGIVAIAGALGYGIVKTVEKYNNVEIKKDDFHANFKK